MTFQKLVEPKNIEKELEALYKDKMRACLFNLIVFHKLSSRTDYIRDIVQKVSEKFPCRVLFISEDPEATTPYLKTAVSFVGACDYIDIGVTKEKLGEVPFLILPHLIPDLPISLLWTEDPTKPHLLFEKLLELASRVIFDSESSESISAFAKKMQELHKKIHIADLNWARTEGWRDLTASLFRSAERLEKINAIEITYNARETAVFCHLKIQSMYLLSWIAARLRWKFDKQKTKVEGVSWDKLGSGAIISMNILTEDGHTYECTRIPTHYHDVQIKASTEERCELPYQFMLGKTATGASLVKEIVNHGTSQHFLETLNMMEKLC